MDAIQKSLELLLAQNQEMSKKINRLETKNMELESKATTARVRVEANKKKWIEANKAAEELLKELSEIQAELKEDRVETRFLIENSVKVSEFVDLSQLWEDVSDKESTSKVLGNDNVNSYGVPFDQIGKEERSDEIFGKDGDYSALAMRRFIEKYKVVKDLNMRAKLRGWDSTSYRAGKLKLCLMGDAFDYVSFASSICEEWTENDELMIEKLKEKFTNIQAVELNILQFEQSMQEPKELLGDYMIRLRRSVKDAYDGDSQRELDRKVAWKFVSGVKDERVRRKLLEEGWMKTRQEAKALEDLLKIAEIAKKTDDAVKALEKTSSVGVAMDHDRGVVAAWEKSGSRSQRSSTDSNTSKASNYSKSSANSKSPGAGYSSSDMPLEFLECFYCKQKHRGGWFHCSRRRRENPKWRPAKKVDKGSGRNDGGSGDFR